MKKTISFVAVMAILSLFAGCGAYKSQAVYDAPSKVLTANYDGTYVIRVQVKARNAAIAFTDAQRKAVKEVMFEGVDAGSNGIQPLKPLCFDKNIQAKHEDYFNAFFADGGEWTKYASLHDKRTATTTYERNGKQMVQMVTVTVKRDDLKKKLQADGLIPAQNMYEL
ncbi:MAG: hypothetical protein MJZ75_00040 [Paludibacteraceae bacterium]|nr:hypothetical protein [Paludibacteraceae bacterium]